MKINRRILLPISVLLLAVLACGGSRDIISNDQPAAQDAAAATNTQPAAIESTTAAQVERVQSAEVADIDYYGDDSLYFIGLIKNTDTVDLEFVEIHVTLRDSSGQLVASESTYSDLDVVPAGGFSPFKLIFFDKPSAWQDYEINIEGDEAGFNNPYLDFEIVSSQGSLPSFGAYEIVGEIRNTGAEDAEFVEIIAVLYDANNHVIGVDFTYSEFDKVTAGGTSPFDLFVFDKAQGEVDHYELFIQGNRAD